MSIPADLRGVLARSTAAAWRKLAPILPSGAYLGGGTAVAVHLRHRESRDLDFFVPEPFDVPALRSRIERAGELVATRFEIDTLNGFLDEAKVQFLLAAGQVQLRPTTVVADIAVASLEDLQAMKLRAITGRGELRDYLDLMEIERRGGLDVLRGLGFYLTRYQPEDAASSLVHIVRALGFLEDVADDPGLPVSREEIEAYWHRRQPDLVRAVARSPLA
ncbi:MAG: nucleotidyl transferase AbiEii/AbiGii toxin family protein [Acidimicrobiales bacterium]